MRKEFILFSVLLSWSSLSHAFNIKKAKMNVLGFIGFGNPSIQILDEYSHQITKNSLGGIGFSIQPWQSTSVEVNVSRFWPDYATEPTDVYGATGKKYKHTSTYRCNNTILFDLTGKTTLYAITPYTKVYARYGIWGLKTQIEVIKEYKLPKTEERLHEETEKQNNITSGPKLTNRGYGVAIGPGVNWRFASRLSLDISGLLYIPTTLPIIGKNEISGIFPVIKGGVNWNIR